MNPILLETAVVNSTEGSPYSSAITVGLMVVMFAVMYFVLIRPQKKRQKEEEKMRSEIQVGDNIVTIGGIVGKIITIKEDSLIIESGVDRSRLQIKKWSIQSNTTVHE